VTLKKKLPRIRRIFTNKNKPDSCVFVQFEGHSKFAYICSTRGYVFLRTLCSLWLILVLISCSSKTEPAPRWITAPAEIYPPDKYLVAVGSGDTRRVAENNAGAGLSRIFESQIRSTETLAENITENSGGIDRTAQLRSDITIDSAQTLLNVRYGETFTDSRGRVYTVAILPRAETAGIYRQKISGIDSEIQQLISAGEITADPVKRYACLRTAGEKAEENELLLRQLQIILPAARQSIQLSYEIPALRNAIAGAAKSIFYSVELNNAGVRDAIRSVLSSYGFSENINSPVFRILGSAIVEDTDLKHNSLVFMRWKLHVEIKTNSGSGFVIDKTSREGHITLAEARARVDRTLALEIRETLPRELDSYFRRRTGM